MACPAIKPTKPVSRSREQHGRAGQAESWASGELGSLPNSATGSPCDPGQVTSSRPAGNSPGHSVSQQLQQGPSPHPHPAPAGGATGARGPAEAGRVSHRRAGGLGMNHLPNKQIFDLQLSLLSTPAPQLPDSLPTCACQHAATRGSAHAEALPWAHMCSRGCWACRGIDVCTPLCANALGPGLAHRATWALLIEPRDLGIFQPRELVLEPRAQTGKGAGAHRAAGH